MVENGFLSANRTSFDLSPGKSAPASPVFPRKKNLDRSYSLNYPPVPLQKGT